ncbi:MAG: 4Fe-4S binding protein [Coriobacteriales bacterium]|jgi:NAD-dependent dihydropyrimidine dehydrogenase PreA subunit|nr:4Fe-4S binding protein [Coriobacteriales bacterium]
MYGTPREFLENRLSIVINAQKCVGCTLCMRFCPLGTVLEQGSDGRVHRSREMACAGCMKCIDRCPNAAISAIRRAT